MGCICVKNVIVDLNQKADRFISCTDFHLKFESKCIFLWVLDSIKPYTVAMLCYSEHV